MINASTSVLHLTSERWRGGRRGRFSRSAHSGFTFLLLFLLFLIPSHSLHVTPAVLQRTTDPLEILNLLSASELSTPTRVANLRRVNKSILSYSVDPNDDTTSLYASPLSKTLDLVYNDLLNAEPESLPDQLLTILPTFSRLLTPSSQLTKSLSNVLSLYPPSFSHSIALSSLDPHESLTIRHPTLPLEYHQNLLQNLPPTPTMLNTLPLKNREMSNTLKSETYTERRSTSWHASKFWRYGNLVEPLNPSGFTSELLEIRFVLHFCSYLRFHVSDSVSNVSLLLQH